MNMTIIFLDNLFLLFTAQSFLSVDVCTGSEQTEGRHCKQTREHSSTVLQSLQFYSLLQTREHITHFSMFAKKKVIKVLELVELTALTQFLYCSNKNTQ